MLEKFLKKRVIRRVEQRMRSLVTSSTKEKNIQIRSGKEWSYDTITKTLYYPLEGSSSIFKLTEQEIIGVLLHEIAHAKYSSLITDVVFPEPVKEYISCVNCVEDLRVERKITNVFPGTYDTLRYLYQQHAKKADPEKIKALPPFYNLLYNAVNSEWGTSNNFSNEELKDIFNKLRPAFEKAYLTNSSLELHKVVETDIWPILVELIPKPTKSPTPGSSGKDDSIAKKSGEDSGKKSGGKENDKDKPDYSSLDIKEDKKPDASEEGSDEVGKKPDDKIDSKETKDQEEMKEAMIDVLDIKELLDKIEDKSSKRKTKKISMIKSIEKEIKLEAKIKEDDLAEAAKPTITSLSRECKKSYEELLAGVSNYIGFFSKKLRSIMDDNQYKRKGGAYKSGKLNNKLLYKWKCNSSRLFSKSILRLHKDYSVCLLIDESGSMQGRKIHNAALSTVLLSEVLSRVNINFEIAGFNGSERIYKQYNQPFNWSVKRNIENIIPQAATRDANDNNDGFAINWAHYRLQQQSGEKILLVMSDGIPENGRGFIPSDDQKRLPSTFKCYDDFDLKTEILKAKQNTVLVGIGICSSHVEKYYPQCVICKEISELPKLILRALRRNIKRG